MREEGNGRVGEMKHKRRGVVESSWERGKV